MGKHSFIFNNVGSLRFGIEIPWASRLLSMGTLTISLIWISASAIATLLQPATIKQS